MLLGGKADCRAGVGKVPGSFVHLAVPQCREVLQSDGGTSRRQGSLQGLSHLLRDSLSVTIRIVMDLTQDRAEQSRVHTDRHQQVGNLFDEEQDIFLVPNLASHKGKRNFRVESLGRRHLGQ